MAANHPEWCTELVTIFQKSKETSLAKGRGLTENRLKPYKEDSNDRIDLIYF